MLEDNPLDALVIRKAVSKISFDTEITLITTGRDYIDKLNHPDYDLILCDYQLPDFDAVKALQVRNQKNSGIPFILITGAVSDEVAISVLKEGADDYILKDRLQRLPFAIEKILRKQRIKSEKNSVEASLSELTERFQLAAKTSFDVIWDYDIQNGLVYCSPAIERIIGKDPGERLKLQEIKEFIYKDDIPDIKRSFSAITKGKENRWRKIFRVIRNDGSIAWVNANALAIRDQQGKPIKMVGVVHDVTEVRHLQHQIIEQELQSQKQITEVTLQAQEKERMEIGIELHDNVNQILATAKIMIDTAKTIPEMHDLCLEKSREAIMDAITELRNLSHSMIPPSFERSTFRHVLNELAYTINLSGKLHLVLSLPPAEKLEQLSSELKLCLYRIIQEQVSNVLKYAKAKRADIIINMDEEACRLIIKDDGIGFDTTKKSKGIGLKNIESRCGLFNGTMIVQAAPGQGCRIKIRIPVSDAAYI
jgi:two-component system, NarL family, sensor histidine kinase UhpB